MFNPRDFEIELTKAAAWMIAAELLFFLIGLFLLYLVIKYAIRDGINESRLAERRWTDGATDPAVRDALRETREAAKVLPPIRAD